MKASLILQTGTNDTQRIASYTVSCAQGDASFCDDLSGGTVDVPTFRIAIALPDLLEGSYELQYGAQIITAEGDPLPEGSGQLSFQVDPQGDLALGDCVYDAATRQLYSVEIINTTPVTDQQWYLFQGVFPAFWEDRSSILRPDPTQYPPMTLANMSFPWGFENQIILVGADPAPVQAFKVIAEEECALR